jgi:uncharacterized membrane protein YoaK (UPF0700 family)
MFRQGKPRTFYHNLRLASLLSLVAGAVNINGVLAINTLTTNVTGHFAFFSEDFVKGNYKGSLLYIFYVLFFLMGAFFSSFLVESGLRIRPRVAHAAPMLIEVSILLVVSFSGTAISLSNESIAFALLFAMGLQNALVTKISQATVRTTHLTGLFTDLGIELSQLFFYHRSVQFKKLSRSIYLRLIIITFFFLGGVFGGLLFNHYNIRALLFAAALLVIALLYDNIRYGFHLYRRKLQSR